jgi:hypothetical protein
MEATTATANLQGVKVKTAPFPQATKKRERRTQETDDDEAKSSAGGAKGAAVVKKKKRVLKASRKSLQANEGSAEDDAEVVVVSGKK